jgi:LPS export ABC transporter protein LptC
MSKIILFLPIIIFVLSCSNSLEDIEKIKLTNLSKTESAKDVRIIYSDSAIVRMIIKAPLMQSNISIEAPKKIFPKGVLVDFYDNNQNISSHLTSKFAEYLENEKMIFMRDSIVIRNYRDEQLETEELYWVEKDSKIYSKKFVKITTNTEVIHGYGFSSNMEFTNWEIDSVSGIFESNALINE